MPSTLFFGLVIWINGNLSRAENLGLGIVGLRMRGQLKLRPNERKRSSENTGCSKIISNLLKRGADLSEADKPRCCPLNHVYLENY